LVLGKWLSYFHTVLTKKACDKQYNFEGRILRIQTLANRRQGFARHPLATAAMASGSSDERLTKKIAQLTKVIVLLNAKNEDFEQEKRSIVQAYEEEIQVILEDARQRVRRVEGSLTDTLAQEDHKRLLSEAEVVYIKQREEDEARFNQHCQSLNDQLQQSNERHQERDQQLHALKQQAMTLQQDVGAISTSAGFKLKDAQRKHTQEVQELRAQHDLRLQEQHDTATTSLSLLQSDLEASQRAFQQTQLELAAKESVLQECQSRSAELELAHRQASDENDNKQGIVAAELKAAQALAAEQSRTISVLEDQLQEAKTAQEDSASECSSAREMMSEQQTELVTLKAEIAQLQARLVETAELSTTDASALTCKLESLTKELGVANSTVATQGKTIQNLDVYCKKAEAALEASATELIKAKKELARLQQQTAEVDGRELNHQAERQRLLHNLDQGEANHQRSLAELQAKQADELKTLESKLLERLGMATRRYDELEKQAQVDKDRQEAKWKSQQDQWHELEQQLKGIASARQLVIEKLELRLNDSSSLATDLHQAQQESTCRSNCVLRFL
jgi:chromosome segregation ATPase